MDHFQHYFSDVPCTYSITVKLDVTPIKERSIKLYPAMLYHLTTIVNRLAEFRTAINEAGDLGVYSNMHPCYTVFHKDTETFSNLWTAYTPDLGQFCAAYEADLRKYGARHGSCHPPFRFISRQGNVFAYGLHLRSSLQLPSTARK